MTQHEWSESGRELLQNIEADIAKSGGYYIWRNACIMENTKPSSSEYKTAKNRQYYSENNRYVTRKKHRYYTMKDDKFITDSMQNGMSQKKIGIELQRSVSSIRRRLYRIRYSK